ncbi:MAG: ComEC/Rec2 family competence protein, partial [Alphaproteobacteria bacterium]|nr:ComEC/Rec2 family competence protein [Alphaproteobacteria bacterium]
YLLISGMAVPAERAFIMTTVVLIGVIFNRQAISMRMVSVAALVILLLQPQSLISISFQMSFAAVYALIAFYEKYAGKIYRLAHRGGLINKIFWYLMGIAIGDFVASLATMPFAVYHFHQVAIYTSLGNLLAGPIIGLWLMPNVLLCLAALPFGLLKYPLLVLGQGLDILNMITAKVSALPDSLISVSTLSFWGFICIIIGGFWLCVWSKKWRLWGILPIMCGVLSMFFAEHPQMIAAPNGTAFALKNNDGKMQILSPKKDRWLRKIWSENFQLDEDYDKSCLEQEFCAYQNVKFNKNGEVWLNNKKLDMCAGGYFYGKENMRFVPLWNCSERRVWTINNAQ